MPKLDDNLPGLGKRTLAPRLNQGASIEALRLSEREGYVLSRIDGRTTLWEVCLLVPGRKDDTLEVLRALRARGVIEIPGSTEPVPVMPAPPPEEDKPADRPTLRPPSGPMAELNMVLQAFLKDEDAGMHFGDSDMALAEPELALEEPGMNGLFLSRGDAPNLDVEVLLRSSESPRFIDDTRTGGDKARAEKKATRRVLPSSTSSLGPIHAIQREILPSDPESEPCDLSDEQRRRIDEVFETVGHHDAFEVLQLGRDADKKAVQRAFMRLSKEFHPDRFFKRQLGPYKAKVTAIFQAITEARDTLIDETRRAAYLAGGS